MQPSTLIKWTSLSIIIGMSCISQANGEHPDETANYAASLLGLQYLRVCNLWDAMLKKGQVYYENINITKTC